MDRKVRVWVSRGAGRDNNMECVVAGGQTRSEAILDTNFCETYSLSFAI